MWIRTSMHYFLRPRNFVKQLFFQNCRFFSFLKRNFLGIFGIGKKRDEGNVEFIAAGMESGIHVSRIEIYFRKISNANNMFPIT